MTYNIHPLIVHFPIALLFFYSIIKIIPFGKWLPNISWKHIERALLIIGVLGALAAAITGNIAVGLVHPHPEIVEMHEFFASLTIFFYSLLLLGEILSLASLANLFQRILTHNSLSKILALLGLLSLSLTGLLGGVMVHNLTSDPLAGIVLKLLGIEY